MNYKYSIFVVLLLASLVVGGSYVNAGVGLGIQPTKISHTIEPGQSVSGFISLNNASDEAVKVEVAVQDFIPTAGTQSIHFIERAEGMTTARDWITIGSPEYFTFQKGVSRDIPYTIKAPSDAEPGSHFAVAFFTARKLDEAGQQLKVGTRVGMLIYLTVPGDFLQKGRILDFSAPRFVQKGPIDFTIKFENTGTVHFEPKGTITITNIFGKKVGEVPVAGQAVLPTGVRDLKARWNVSSFLLGRYKAALSIVDGEGNVLTAESIAFYALPLWYILGFILAVLVLFFGLKFLRKKLKISISFKKKE